MSFLELIQSISWIWRERIRNPEKRRLVECQIVMAQVQGRCSLLVPVQRAFGRRRDFWIKNVLFRLVGRYKRFIERNLSFLQGHESGGDFLVLQRGVPTEILEFKLN